MTDLASQKKDSLAERFGKTREYIQDAIAQADPNILRMALLQTTGDRTFADMRTDKVPLPGGWAFDAYVVAEEHHEDLRKRAFALLEEISKGREVPPAPPKAEARKLIENYGHGPVSDAQFSYGYEELAFEDFSRGVSWTNKPPAEVLADTHVVVIGAGAGGIAAGVQLKNLGIPFTIYERQDSIGGTWLLNQYPDARVDTGSHLYQYKFEKNYPFKEFFAQADEIQEYLNHVADKYDIRQHMKFGSEVTSAKWNEKESAWYLGIICNGSLETIKANFIISASGLFATPKNPDIKGIDTFKGQILRTAGWDRSANLNGKRVALIGNGSSGVQLMSTLAEQASKLDVYVRTPQWIAPMGHYRDEVPDKMQWMLDNFPYYFNWFSYTTFYMAEQLQVLQDYDEDWRAQGGHINEKNDNLRKTLEQYIREKLANRPDLVEQVMPDHPPMARRLIMDNRWYESLNRPNVELVKAGIQEIRPEGILTTDGVLHEVDVIVSAMGFAMERYFVPINYEGRDGVSLDQFWATDGARSYLGLVMPGFPNLFALYGPNGQPRAGSYHSWAEMWTRYAVTAITHVLETGNHAIDLKRSVFDEYNARLDEGGKASIWEREGQGSYLLNQHGRSYVNMPWSTMEYYEMIQSPRWNEFDIG